MVGGGGEDMTLSDRALAECLYCGVGGEPGLTWVRGAGTTCPGGSAAYPFPGEWPRAGSCVEAEEGALEVSSRGMEARLEAAEQALQVAKLSVLIGQQGE